MDGTTTVSLKFFAAALIKEIVSTIAQIPDGIGRSVYIKECSIVMDIPEQTLMNELNKSLRKKHSRPTSPSNEDFPVIDEKRIQPSQIEIDPLEITALENEIMKLILNFGQQNITVENTETEHGEEWKIVEYLISDFRNDQIKFENPIFNEILKEFENAMEKDHTIDSAYFINHPSKRISSAVVELLADKEQLSDNWKKNKIFVKKAEDNLEEYFDSIILPLKSRLIAKMLKDIGLQIKLSDNDSERMLLMQIYHERKQIQTNIDRNRDLVFNH